MSHIWKEKKHLKPLMSGVTICHKSVVSAGTIVNKKVSPYGVVSGNSNKVQLYLLYLWKH